MQPSRMERFKAVTELITLVFTLSSDSCVRNTEGEEGKPVMSDESLILFMQIRCRVFLTMQTLADNKLFVFGL